MVVEFDIMIVDGKHQFQGQFSRRDLEVTCFLTVSHLTTQKILSACSKVARHKTAVELEDRVNREIRLLMASEAMFAHEEVLLII